MPKGNVLITGLAAFAAIITLWVWHFGDAPLSGTDDPTEASVSPILDGYIQVNLTMNGAFQSAYGISKDVALYLSGTITKNSSGHDALNIVFDFSKDCPYQLETPTNGFVSTNRKDNELKEWYIVTTEAYNRESGVNTPCVFAISINKKYCLMLFKDSPNCHLAVSADALADVETIRAYFIDFIQAYSWASWKEDGSAVEHSSEIDLTLNASKCSASGEKNRAVTITITGRVLHFRSGESRLDVSIAEFDGFKQFQAIINSNNGIVGHIQPNYAYDYSCVYYVALDNNSETTDFFILHFSPDMDKWMVMNTTDKVFYVGSASGNCTTAELLEYFQGAVPSNWKSDSH